MSLFVPPCIAITLVVLANTAIVSSSDWQDKMTKLKTGGSFDIIQSGSAPNVEMQLMSTATGSSATRLYYTSLAYIQQSELFVCSFQLKMSTGGNEFFFYVGHGDGDWGGVNVRYAVVFNLVQNKIYLKKAGTTVATADFSASGNWEAVSIAYTKGTSNTWVVSWKGNNVITYSDNDIANWVRSSGNYWGFGAWDSAKTANMYIKDVTLNVYTASINGEHSNLLNRCSIYRRSLIFFYVYQLCRLQWPFRSSLVSVVSTRVHTSLWC